MLPDPLPVHFPFIPVHCLFASCSFSCTPCSCPVHSLSLSVSPVCVQLTSLPPQRATTLTLTMSNAQTPGAVLSAKFWQVCGNPPTCVFWQTRLVPQCCHPPTTHSTGNLLRPNHRSRSCVCIPFTFCSIMCNPVFFLCISCACMPHPSPNPLCNLHTCMPGRPPAAGTIGQPATPRTSPQPSCKRKSSSCTANYSHTTSHCALHRLRSNLQQAAGLAGACDGWLPPAADGSARYLVWQGHAALSTVSLITCCRHVHAVSPHVLVACISVQSGCLSALCSKQPSASLMSLLTLSELLSHCELRILLLSHGCELCPCPLGAQSQGSVRTDCCTHRAQNKASERGLHPVPDSAPNAANV